MCEFCENTEKTLYQKSRYGDAYIDRFGKQAVMAVNPKVCPPFSNCGAKDMNICICYKINFCPNCGADLR